MIEKITKANKCWPKEIPFLAKGNPHEQKDDTDEGILWCHRQSLREYGLPVQLQCYGEYLFQQSVTLTLAEPHERERMYHNFVRANRQCSELCGKDCLRDYFETIFQGIDWPSKEAITVHASDQTRNQLKELHGCCALVSVLYSSHMVQINQIYAKTELVSFLAEVGGTISMWVGISILSSYTLIEMIIDVFVRAKRIAAPS